MNNPSKSNAPLSSTELDLLQSPPLVAGNIMTILGFALMIGFLSAEMGYSIRDSAKQILAHVSVETK